MRWSTLLESDWVALRGVTERGYNPAPRGQGRCSTVRRSLHLAPDGMDLLPVTALSACFQGIPETEACGPDVQSPGAGLCSKPTSPCSQGAVSCPSMGCAGGGYVQGWGPAGTSEPSLPLPTSCCWDLGLHGTPLLLQPGGQAALLSCILPPL